MSTQQMPERDCTPKCRSRNHASLLVSCATKGSSAEIRSYCNWLCHNFGTVSDEWGRNILHLVASCGKWEIVKWLIEKCRCEVDVRDAESGWTALHRSFFYGQIAVARVLLNHDANIRMVDHEGLTPLDILVEDRPSYIEYNITYPQDVYVWGSNANFNLGLGNEQSRAQPELLEVFHKENVNIKQVVMCKFHTAFLSNDGRIFTCGHGHGGRLGQGSEITGLIPSAVHGLGSSACQQVAAGQDHLLLLMEGGQIWTCGLNTYHQLGHNPPPENLVTPKPISLKFLKGKQILGVCAARFHSVFYTKDSLYTFGLNAGQLGHPKGVRSHILPHQVSGVYDKEWKIDHVTASDGATVCATNRGDVYVLHEYQHRKIASRQLEIQKLSVVGGLLDSSCDTAVIREGGGLELRVLLLTKSGKLYLWRQSNPYLRRCLFTSSRQLSISDVEINHYSLAMVTHNNQAYIGTIVSHKKKTSVSAPQSMSPVTKTQKISSQMNVLLDRDDCDFIRPKKIPHVYRATVITSDSKGRNICVLQASPKVGLLDLPVISDSKIISQFWDFYKEMNLFDSVHDVVIKVEQKEYAANKFILSSRSMYFKKQLMDLGTLSQEKPVLVIEHVVPEAFEQIMKFIYSNSCDFLVEGCEIKWLKHLEIINGHAEQKTKNKINNKNKNSKAKDVRSDPVKCMLEASKRFNLYSLTKILETAQLSSGRVHLPYGNKRPELKFDRHSFPEYHDVRLVSEDGVEYPCHKCILIARSDYFHSMLGSSCWIEKTRLESLSLPIPSKVLDVLLHYFYSDAGYISGIEDPELLCQLLAIADQLLIRHLKEMCEMALVNLMSIKNAPELLQLAHFYNAVQLKGTAMEFICINLPSIIEARNFDVLSDDVMEDLSRIYRRTIGGMSRRNIKSHTSAPSKEDLAEIQKKFPIAEQDDMARQKIDVTAEAKSKHRHRMKSLSIEVKKNCDEKKPQKGLDSPVMGKKVDASLLMEDVIVKKTEIDLKPQETMHIATKTPENTIVSRKPGQWTMSCPKVSDVLSLDLIMAQEKKMTTLVKSAGSHTEKKRLPHLSQKQKKQLAKESISPPLKIEPQSPPACPWGNISTSPPAPLSFWDSPSRKNTHNAVDTSLCSIESPSPGVVIGSPTNFPLLVPMTLDEIQKAERDAQSLAVKQKMKPLNLINIEDQAIEELLIMYRAKDNSTENITVSRVIPTNVAKPTWCRQPI